MSSRFVRGCALVALFGCGGKDTTQVSPQATLTLTASGTGSGRVVSSPAGIDCTMTGSTATGACFADFPRDSKVTLTTTASGSSSFSTWGGACSGSSCELTMAGTRSANAAFDLLPGPVLTLTSGMTGGGTVMSSPGGINCVVTVTGRTGACAATFPAGSIVTLTATSDPSSTLTAWGGACLGHPCQVTMSADRTVSIELTTCATTTQLGCVLGDAQFSSIPAGSFQMGSVGGAGGSFPVRTVTLSAFRIQRTEITQGQWRALMDRVPDLSFGCGDTCPITSVSWEDAQSFIVRLNASDPGKGYRLPTEAEWEYAARATTVGDFGGTGIVDEMAWTNDNTVPFGPKPVARKQPNAWGLYDMHGNAMEWVNDWDAAYGSEAQLNPTGPSWSPFGRVLRGGSYFTPSSGTSSFFRWRFAPGNRGIQATFRLVRAP